MIHIKHRAGLLFVALFVICTTALAQSFKARIEPAGAYYRLTYTISSTDAEAFVAPSLPDFEVLSGPNESKMNSMQVINGAVTKSESTTYTFILSARKSGKVTIGPASVRVGHKTFRSNAVQASVHESGASSSQHGGSGAHSGGSSQAPTSEVQQAGSPVTQRDLFIDVTPSRTKVHEQEAILLTYRIHSRLGVGLSNTQLVSTPDFKGFISQDIPLPNNQIQTTIEHRAGGTYRTGTLLQYVLFPQQSGRITVPGMTFDCTVVQQEGGLDLIDAFFNGGGSIGVTVKRTVAPLTIDVEALPQPKPATFSGAVGHFDIKGELLNPNVRTNDVSTYRITLNGVGNMKLITAPKMAFPKDFDSYDPKTNQNTKTTAQGLTGQITFDYTFVARNVGRYTIPSVAFTYFDTESNSYRTLHTAPVTIDVKQGERSNSDVEHQLALLHSDIRGAHGVESFGERPWLSFGHWSLPLAAVLLVLAFVLVQRMFKSYIHGHSDTAENRQRHAAKRYGKQLDEARTHLGDADTQTFYALTSRALYGFVADFYRLPHAEMSKEAIRTTLASKGVDEADIRQLIDVLDECEMAQYAPSSEASRQDAYDKACHIIQKLSSR